MMTMMNKYSIKLSKIKLVSANIFLCGAAVVQHSAISVSLMTFCFHFSRTRFLLLSCSAEAPILLMMLSGRIEILSHFHIRYHR